MKNTQAASEIHGLVETLRRRVQGEVRFDKMTRILYSTDASIYQIEPIGVILPRSSEDVVAVVETANSYGVPILPRGGGTSLAGQTVANALVIDFSKYMRNVIEVNREEGWVFVQPGIILDELNHQICQTNMMFAPDPSTSNRSNVGGALGNNSCGSHSIVWGKTIDNVVELDVVLSNGDQASFAPYSADMSKSNFDGDSLEANIYRTLQNIGQKNRNEVLSRYPKILRRVSGYNLDELIKDSPPNLARFIVGSEGTLATIVGAKLKIVPKPEYKALSVLHFRNLIEAMEATVAVMELGPSAVELMDDMIVRQARSQLEYSRMMGFVHGDPAALLLVEMVGDSVKEVESKLDDVEVRMSRSGLTYAIQRVVDSEDQDKVWAVRKAGLGLMMSAPGEDKPLPFVEDTAVPLEVLPEYVKRFDEVVQKHGTTAGYYGHASVGCLHVRPLVNLKRRDGVDRMEAIASDISDLVLEFGGSMSGEHGDGLVRSMWTEKMFGSKIYEAFRQVKMVFDPKGIMNPGKIVNGPSMTDNLRISPNYRTVSLTTEFSFSDQGGFAAAIEMCNGQGACRKVTSGTMCPSYMLTRDEEHSTRGRANALRAAMSGALPVDTLTDKRLYDVLDLCLECKACKAECPSGVDMARLKYEFLGRYHKMNGYPLRNKIFGNLSELSRLGSLFAPLSNWALKLGVFKTLLESYAGIDQRRQVPLFSSQSFNQWSRVRDESTELLQKGKVLLFPDTFTNYNHPELGQAATKVIETLGYEVVVPDLKCCGRPMLSAGMIDKARHNAEHNVETVLSHLEEGAKLVGIEPSCILTFRDDYKDLLGGDTKTRIVAENTMLIEEFVLFAMEKDGAEIEFSGDPGNILFHGHCHQKALVGTDKAMRVLRMIPGCDPQEVKSGCCGMAGAFGFQTEHYQASMDIGKLVLFPEILSRKGDFTVVSDGVSCRQQIEQGTGRKAKHLVEILADSI